MNGDDMMDGKVGSLMRTLVILVGAACAGILALPQSADAQQDPNVIELDAQNFRPAVGPYSIFKLETADTLDHLQPTGGLMLNYASEPLVLEPDEGPSNSVIDQQLAMHVYAGIGLIDRIQLDLELPVYFVNDGVFGEQTIEGSRLGDLSFRPKVNILSSEDDPVGLGAQLDLTLPTGDAESFVGYPGVQFTPSVIADVQFANIIVATNIGVKIRQNQDIRNLALGERLEYGLGAEAEFVDGLLRIGGELNGATELRNPFGEINESPLEGLLGAKIVTPSGFRVIGGAGGGFIGGYGSPEFRAFLGLSYANTQSDSDDDGIDDDEDDCPETAEDYDGFEDQDGCPDEDNDEDGIKDVNDKCPNQKGPEDNDGCPVAEETQDPDGDGVIGENDECPEKAEDRDGFEDEDGCSDPDNDGDGIEDEADNCPNQMEDKDGYKDEDGCPDKDNDLDGIADVNDKCPDEPGLEANQGCPAAEPKVVRRKQEIEILEKVFFETDKAVIKPQSFNLLQQVGLVLRSNPDILKVEIQGHTDSRGSEEYNKKLSEARAQAVKTYLVEEAGIDEERLTAKGFGEEKLIDESGTEQAMARNRRVEFKIVEQEAVPVEEAVEEAAEGDDVAPEDDTESVDEMVDEEGDEAAESEGDDEEADDGGEE
jgi:outer membrane protein OmpA-like peptidoglycan-associated protein